MSPQKLQQQGAIGLAPSLTATTKGMDEFKYGFPSNGLSLASNKWWGSTSGDDADEEDHTHQNDKLQSENKERLMNDTSENGWGETETGAALLSAVRKRAAKEGGEALKLGVHRSSYGVKKLDSKHKALLLRIFGPSFPHI